VQQTTGINQTLTTTTRAHVRIATIKTPTLLVASLIGAAVVTCHDHRLGTNAQIAPKMKMTAEIPPQITMPDSVETWLGTLKFFDGSSRDDPTVEDIRLSESTMRTSDEKVQPFGSSNHFSKGCSSPEKHRCSIVTNFCPHWHRTPMGEPDANRCPNQNNWKTPHATRLRNATGS
jgi:hypothetical protein